MLVLLTVAFPFPGCYDKDKAYISGSVSVTPDVGSTLACHALCAADGACHFWTWTSRAHAVDAQHHRCEFFGAGAAKGSSSGDYSGPKECA